MNSLQSTLFLTAIAVGLLGMLVVVAAHLAFLRVLSIFHPDLWREWKTITRAFDWEMGKYRKLVSRVYSQISEPVVLRAYHREVVCRRTFAVCLIFATAAFVVSRFL
jgi:hypothetical protein